MAEYEARKTSKRIRFNNKMRIKNRQVVTGDQNFLFPWKVVGEKRNRHLEKDMSQAERLYDLLDYFEMHQTKSGTVAYNNSKYEPISYETLSKLLTDTLLYGEYKGVPDYVAPWITKQRFDNIAAILKRTTRIPASPNREFLFSGIIRCYRCGKPLVGNSHIKNNKYTIFSYRCNTNRLKRTCENNSSTSERKIEKQLLDGLDKFITNEIVKVNAIKEKKSPVIDNTKKIAAIKKEISRLNTMYRKGRIEEEEYDADFAELDKALKALEAVEMPVERDLTALKKLVESDYRTIYNALDRPHKKAFWRKIIKEFAIGEDKKIIPESIIFF